MEVKQMYTAFGLTIESELRLPELIYMENQEMPDVLVQFKNLAETWANHFPEDGFGYIRPNLFLFKIDHVAIFQVLDGRFIHIHPLLGANIDQIRLYVLGTCFGAILIQRNVLPLHGSAVVIDGEAYGIVGNSGAGKSTLASAFVQRGYELVTDDVMAIRFHSDHTPFISPAYPQQKLWEQSLNQFGMEARKLQPIVNRESKYFVPIARFHENPVPLKGIFELNIGEELQSVTMENCNKLEKIHKLLKHTYRNYLLEPSGLMGWHFKQSTKLASQMQMYELTRPRLRFTTDELVEMILTEIRKGEGLCHRELV